MLHCLCIELLSSISYNLHSTTTILSKYSCFFFQWHSSNLSWLYFSKSGFDFMFSAFILFACFPFIGVNTRRTDSSFGALSGTPIVGNHTGELFAAFSQSQGLFRSSYYCLITNVLQSRHLLPSNSSVAFNFTFDY